MKVEVRGGRTVVTLKNEATDGHTRITEGADYRIEGGSAELHDRFVAAWCKSAENLRAQGLTIETADSFLLAETIVRNLLS